MTPSYIFWVLGEGGVAAYYSGKQESADDSIKQELQNSGSGKAVSPPPSLLLQGDMGIGGPHSLLAMCTSAEKQIWDYVWYWGRNHQKKKRQHVVNFQTLDTS